MSLIIYTKRGCGWCTEALAFLKEHNIGFEEREVRSNTDFMKELKDKSNQNRTPTLDLDGEILVDVGVDEIEPFLKVRGIL